MLAYRYITGTEAEFGHRVTEALANGWSLYGDPGYTHDAAAGAMRCGQAVVKEVEVDYDPSLDLAGL